VAVTVVVDGYRRTPEFCTAITRRANSPKVLKSWTLAKLYSCETLLKWLVQHFKDMPCTLGELIGSRNQYPHLDGLRGSRAPEQAGEESIADPQATCR
jgi:hypothetical protein